MQLVLPQVTALTVGMPEDDADITPVVSESSADFIQSLVFDARDKGATFLTPWRREGNLIWPCLVDNVTPDMRLAWEEPFGPLLPIMRVDGPDAAVAHCNASKLALQVIAFVGVGYSSCGWEGTSSDTCRQHSSPDTAPCAATAQPILPYNGAVCSLVYSSQS